MSVAADLDSLHVSQPAVRRRPRLTVVPCDPVALPVGEPQRQASVSVLHAPSRASIAPPLRLTRRGVAVLAAGTAALGAVLVWAAAASAPASPGPAPAAARAAGPATVTVQAGDTLWAVASRVAPGRDPRAEVATLRHLNHLADPGVMPGQVLRVR